MKQVWESILKVTTGNLFRFRKTTSISYRKTDNYFHGPVYFIDNTKKDLKKIKFLASKAKR